MTEDKSIDKTEAAQSISCLWTLLTEKEQQQFTDQLQIVRYEKDEAIFNEGDTPTHLTILLDGTVKISKNGVGGRKQIIRMMRCGTIFGFRASFVGEKYMTTASANAPCLAGRIPLSLVMKLIEENSQIAVFFIKLLAMGLGLADRTIVSMTQKHLRGRLAETLLRLLDNFGTKKDGLTLNIYMSREDIAHLSNMTTSNAIRTLSAFAQEGLIAIEGKGIHILDVKGLEKISAIG